MPQHPGKNKGGRLPPDNRGAQAKGVGKNAKRHDLERPATPGLHGSSLQKGDVQAMEQGQRIAPIQEQERGRSQQPSRASRNGQTSSQGVKVPDAIEFFGQRSSGPPAVPSAQPNVTSGKLEKWGAILEQVVASPGASGGLAEAYVNQLRNLRKNAVNRPATSVNLNDVDDGLEAMLGNL